MDIENKSHLLRKVISSRGALTILILISLLFGAVVYYQYCQILNFTIGVPGADRTVYWTIYRNRRFQYKIKYPPFFLKSEKAGVLTLEAEEYQLYFIVRVLDNPKNYELEKFYSFYSSPGNESARDKDVGKEVIDRYKNTNPAKFITATKIEGIKFRGQEEYVISFLHNSRVFELIMPSEMLVSPQIQTMLSFMIVSFSFLK